ncbi:helix-turn-helix transcriptional regulator [Variovorax sp. dw_954]|uniref:helix-turn-helix transcriptional regulator n=1 Tax=Variovorax sp. dw_954 TaxID=2720078 RepID=UPI001BD566D5|nr:helix-turn-helix transcriptional regulator [Variovorax sp. dw_954]
MTRMSAIAHFRRLCCLGLQPQAVMPSLLSAAHELLPSETNGFFWADEHGRLAGFTPEYVIPEVVTTLAENLEGVVERSLPLDFETTMLRGGEVGNLLPFFTRDFYRGDTYHLIYRPYALHHAIDGVVRDTPNGKGLGAFVLGRSARQPEFSAAEKATLRQMLPYVAHAMHPPESCESGGLADEFADSGDNGLVILDERAEVAYMSARARQILYVAAHANASADYIPPAILSVFANLVRISRGREAAPPVVCCDSPMGRFVFRAHWLDPLSEAANAMVGVTVQQQEPLVLVMVRNMHAAGLSDKQMALCLLLAQNHTFASIAAQLHISLATAKDYADRVYRKLDVHTREEALRKLGRT